jgi:hypothetical protein
VVRCPQNPALHLKMLSYRKPKGNIHLFVTLFGFLTLHISKSSVDNIEKPFPAENLKN